MTTTGTTERSSNWSGLPLDIFELIIGRLRGVDRFRIQAVCKAWSVPNRHVRSTIHELPWAFKFPLCKVKDNSECQLVDLLSQEYVVEGKECQVSLDATKVRPRASAYGWVLFQFWKEQQKSFFMYSPFTTEVIQLPLLRECPGIFKKATFSLNATSPKCVIFVLWIEEGIIYVNLCSPRDNSWKTFEFNDLNDLRYVVDVTYADGFFYCVFKGGQLGAFNVEREEWTTLVKQPLPGYSLPAKLIKSDNGDLRMLSSWKPVKLFKFDFSQICWVYENDYLNDHALFIGCTSFSTRAIGETSQLAKIIFASPSEYGHPHVRFYGSTSCSLYPLYLKFVEATQCKPFYSIVWIEVPFGGIWRANDLIHPPL